MTSLTDEQLAKLAWILRSTRGFGVVEDERETDDFAGDWEDGVVGEEQS